MAPFHTHGGGGPGAYGKGGAKMCLVQPLREASARMRPDDAESKVDARLRTKGVRLRTFKYRQAGIACLADD